MLGFSETFQYFWEVLMSPSPSEFLSDQLSESLCPPQIGQAEAITVVNDEKSWEGSRPDFYC